jgi:hypothetical protein
LGLKAEIKRVALFQPEFVEDLSYWVETERRTAKRLLDLIKAVVDPIGVGLQLDRLIRRGPGTQAKAAPHHYR